MQKRNLIHLIFVLIKISHAFNDDKTTMDQILKIFESYDSRIRPYMGKTLNITANIYVGSISKLNQEDMRYDMDVFFRQFWNDPRLILSNFTDKTTTVDEKLISSLWIPDLFFANGVGSSRHHVVRRNALLRLSPEGDITLSERFTVSMDCEMNFEMFPFDSQACPLSIESYAYGKSELNFDWKKDGDKSPIDYSEGLGMSDFMQGVKYVKYNCTAEYSTGLFSCLQGYFILDRQVGYYLLWAFLPAGMCVMISWMGFWIKLTVAPARVALGITTFLAVKTLGQSFSRGMPKVSYVKMIDIWMIGCDSFVFCAILEFTLAQFLMRRQSIKARPEKITDESKTSIKKYQVEPFESERNDVESQIKTVKTKVNTTSDQKANLFLKIIGLETYSEPIKEAHWVDEVAKRIFPIAFLIFNIAFWTHVKNQPSIENQLNDNGFIKF